MNWDAIGSIGEIIGATAVVLTLLYLSSQIKQSTAATTSNSMHSLLEDWRGYCQTWASDPDLIDLHLRGSADYLALTTNEQYRFYLFMVQFVFQAQIADEMFEQGTISEYDRDVWLNFVVSSLNTPGGRQLWSKAKSSYTPKIAELITTGLESSPINSSWMYDNNFLQRQPSHNSLPPADR